MSLGQILQGMDGVKDILSGMSANIDWRVTQLLNQFNSGGGGKMVTQILHEDMLTCFTSYIVLRQHLYVRRPHLRGADGVEENVNGSLLGRGNPTRQRLGDGSRGVGNGSVHRQL